jgi:membrane-associated phospholipid phosphatase
MRRRVGIMLGFYVCWGVAYSAAAALAALRSPFDVASTLDAAIPYAPNAVWGYLLCYGFPLVPAMLAPRGAFAVYVRAAVLMSLSAFAVFLLAPVAMVRPELGSSAAEQALALIRVIDGPQNCLPSLHAGFAVLAALRCHAVGPRLAIVGWLVAVAICAGALLVKQHWVADIATGALLGLIAERVARRSS